MEIPGECHARYSMVCGGDISGRLHLLQDWRHVEVKNYLHNLRIGFQMDSTFSGRPPRLQILSIFYYLMRFQYVVIHYRRLRSRGRTPVERPCWVVPCTLWTAFPSAERSLAPGPSCSRKHKPSALHNKSRPIPRNQTDKRGTPSYIYIYI